MEEWKDYSETMQVSNKGRARQRPRLIKAKHKYSGTCNIQRKPKIRKTFLGAGKHPTLLVDGKHVKLCEAIAKIWLGPCPKGKKLVHLDGNKRNNKLDNLAYVDA